MNMTYRHDVGDWGEDIACNYLTKLGYLIVERNYYTRYGEIDIIARKDDQLFFIEVKTRTSTSYGLPEEAFTNLKQEHLFNSILVFLEGHPDEKDNWQIDLISVEGKYLAQKPKITHFQNVILE